MNDAETDVLAFMSFPKDHRVKIRSTNPLERDAEAGLPVVDAMDRTDPAGLASGGRSKFPTALGDTYDESS